MSKRVWICGALLLAVVFAGNCLLLSQSNHRAKKIVLIAGKKSHGPGLHEYLKSVKLLKVMLAESPNLNVKAELHFNGWPEDPRTLDTADSIVTISDGQDGDLYSPVPFMTEARMPVIEKQMKRGCGLVTIHFSTFAPDKYGPQILEWGGGYFDWQGGDGKRSWYSAIKTLTAEVKPGQPNHPITSGVAPFQIEQEFYYRIRFLENDPRLVPILRVPDLANDLQGQVVAWAVQRQDGGRGFGTTMGHFYRNWKHDDYRKLMLNGIVWTARAAVPEGGVQSSFLSDEDVDRKLMVQPIKTLLVTGNNHPSHKWQETTPAIIAALNSETPRFNVTVTEDAEFLARKDLLDFKLVVLNYCNWEKPGLSDAAKSNFVRFLRKGGGLTLIHFSNGAFHFSLPKAAESDWLEYRKICRRVWDHSDKKTGHDRYGKFRVEIAKVDHPVVRSIEPFETKDELYYNQHGDDPIQVLATARSQQTGKEEPMAFVYSYDKARVFQTLLGHSAESIEAPGATQLIRYGSLWAAGKQR
jgi:type 1 glutamine amidotransferase